MQFETDTANVRFLIIRFSSIGDIVLTTPTVRGLKQQVEGAEIHFLTKRSYEDLLKANPYIDYLHLYDQNLGEIIHELKKIRFHYVIDLHKNLRSLWVKAKLQAIPFSVNKLNWQKWLMVNTKINRLPDIHIVDRYLDTVTVFDVVNDGEGLDYFLKQEDHVSLSGFPEAFQKDFVAVAIGGQHNTKKLPVDLLGTLCRLIHYPVVLMGGKEDMENAERIMSELNGGDVFNACGKFTVNQSASLIQQSRCVVTHDTGLMHIAAAYKKLVFSIWGNTIPEFGMAPYLPGKHSRIFEVKGLSCRPCSKIGYSKCPKGHFKCMREIPIHEIAEAVNRCEVS